MVSVSRGYIAGKFALLLEGVHVGFLYSAEGGEPFATVVREPAVDGIVPKHVGTIEYAPLRLSFGTGMTKELYDWVAEFLRRERAARSGAVAFLGYDYNEQLRVEFEGALITEVSFPALDAAGKEPAYISVTIQPKTTRVTDASRRTAYKGFGTKAVKKLQNANFELKIDPRVVAKVKGIAAITVRQASDIGAVLEVPDITLTVPQTGADGFADWLAQDVLTGGDSPNAERTGTLRFLSADAKTVFFTLTLSQLCVTSLRAERQTVGGGAVLAQTGVQLYCERLSFESSADAIGTTVADKVADAPVPSSEVTHLADTLVGVVSGRLRGEDAVRAALRIAQSPVLSASDGAGDPELVARRLMTTVRVPEPHQSDSRRADGAALGARWAAELATLEELEQVAALETAEWSAATLTDDHSLIALLGDAGIVPRGEGRLDLQRDEFVEGIVTGASGVLRVAAPHLSRDRPSSAVGKPLS